MLAQAWPAVGLGAIVAILLGSVLASAYATAPNRLRRLPTTWTSEDRADHYREVMAEMQRAVAAAPACAAAHSNFGRALAECGRFDEAIKQFERALEIEPGNAKTPNNLAAALAARGRFAEAIAQLQTVLAREPDNVQVLSSLANVLASAGRPQEAIQHYQKVLTIAPCSPEVETSLAIALLAGGRYVEAVSHFCHAAELAPYNPRCQLNLAWFRATCPIAALRNGAEAVEHAQRASQLGDGNNVEVLDTLAAAYAEAGRFPEAANAARQALDLARQQDSRSLAAVLRTRLVLYEAGKPFHESPPASVNLQTK
jgi:Flp pilus assembly protein TadD